LLPFRILVGTFIKINIIKQVTLYCNGRFVLGVSFSRGILSGEIITREIQFVHRLTN